MITRTDSFETPNFGNGPKDPTPSHGTAQCRRDSYSPTELAIQMELLSTEPGVDPRFIIKFQVADVQNQSHPEFQKLLFFNLNLLQENVGACDVFKANAELPELLGTITVDWEILPSGDRKGNLARILAGRPPDANNTGDRAVKARSRP